MTRLGHSRADALALASILENILRENQMKKLIAKLHIAIMNLKSEEGQDLVEYALLIALIAFACTSGMGHLATSINSMFNSIAGKLTIA